VSRENPELERRDPQELRSTEMPTRNPMKENLE